jgi:hypothetical protein
MSTGPQNTAPSSFHEALDPELVARLGRRLVQPGIISPVIARRIMGVVDYFARRLPLMEDMLRKRSGGGALKHDDLPVVYAELPPEPATPPAAEVLASREPPEVQIVVQPIERIIERPAAPALERVIDRSAPPALDLIREQPERSPERTTTPVIAGTTEAQVAPILTSPQGLPATPSAAVTPVNPVVTAESATPDALVNPTVHITTVMSAAPAVAATPGIAGTTPVIAAAIPVIAAAPAVATARGIAAAPDSGAVHRDINSQVDDASRVDRLPIASPESRALSREPLADIALPAATSTDSRAATPARIERAPGSAARPEIQIARRSTVESPGAVSRPTPEPRAEVDPALSVRARRAQVATSFTVSPRAQDPGTSSRLRDMDLTPMSDAMPARSQDIGPERSMLGQRVERPASFSTPLHPEGQRQWAGRGDEPFDVVRPRSLRSPDATDMPHISSEAGHARSQGRAAPPETAAARLPVVKPARPMQRRDREGALIEASSEPLARVRPSPPPGSAANVVESPARSFNERPTVRPQSKSAPFGEAAPALAPKGHAGRESPLPRVIPQKAPGFPQAADRSPLPHAPAESLRERLNDFPPAQPGHPAAWAPGIAAPAGAAPPSAMRASIVSSPPPAAPASLPAEPGARPESAPPEIDMTALVNQVQRKIMRNLAIERSRKGGLR